MPISRYESNLLTHDSFINCARVFEFSLSALRGYADAGRLDTPGLEIDSETYGRVVTTLLAGRTIAHMHKVQIARENGREAPEAPRI